MGTRRDRTPVKLTFNKSLHAVFSSKGLLRYMTNTGLLKSTLGLLEWFRRGKPICMTISKYLFHKIQAAFLLKLTAGAGRLLLLWYMVMVCCGISSFAGVNVEHVCEFLFHRLKLWKKTAGTVVLCMFCVPSPSRVCGDHLKKQKRGAGG